MLQITTGSVDVGDVLYHPAMGFAQVARREEDTLLLAWERDGREGLPRRVTESSAARTWRRCRPNGFFARSVTDARRLRRLLHQDGREVLKLLLEDLESPQSPQDLAQWLEGRGLLDEAEFEHWWQRLDPTQDPLFSYRGGRLSLSGAGDTAPIEVERPWVQRGALVGVPWVHAGMDLCGLLAREHAAGRGTGLSRTSLVLDGGNLHILPGKRSTPAADTRQAGLLLLERLLGRSIPDAVPVSGLAPFLAGLAEDLPLSALPLLEQMLCADDRGPSSAVGLFPQWAAAAANEDLRRVADPGPGRFRVGADTHIGWVKMRGQQANQDFMAVEQEGEEMLVVVCDGISTSDAGTGDLASRIVTDVLIDAWNRRPRGLGRDITAARDFITEALREANTRVCEAALQVAGGSLRDRIPMGTTVVMALVHGDLVDLAWLGDSRAYVRGSTGAACLTADHNVLLEWLRGLRPMDERNAHMGRTLTRYVGHFEHSTPSLLPVQHRRLRLLSGEWLVLCSDGVTDYATPDHLGFVRLLESLTPDHADPQQVAQALVDAANRGGGGDNATAVALQLGR